MRAQVLNLAGEEIQAAKGQLFTVEAVASMVYALFHESFEEREKLLLAMLKAGTLTGAEAQMLDSYLKVMRGENDS